MNAQQKTVWIWDDDVSSLGSTVDALRVLDCDVEIFGTHTDALCALAERTPPDGLLVDILWSQGEDGQPTPEAGLGLVKVLSEGLRHTTLVGAISSQAGALEPRARGAGARFVVGKSAGEQQKLKDFVRRMRAFVPLASTPELKITSPNRCLPGDEVHVYARCRFLPRAEEETDVTMGVREGKATLLRKTFGDRPFSEMEMEAAGHDLWFQAPESPGAWIVGLVLLSGDGETWRSYAETEITVTKDA